eukprot:PDM67226.1 hypothetical protein PRIPAC_48643 [Pristionchus pacificus]
MILLALLFSQLFHMAANFLSIKMKEYLTKLQKSSKTERYLRKLSTMGVTMNLLMETNAIEMIKPFTAHPSRKEDH